MCIQGLVHFFPLPPPPHPHLLATFCPLFDTLLSSEDQSDRASAGETQMVVGGATGATGHTSEKFSGLVSGLRELESWLTWDGPREHLPMTSPQDLDFPHYGGWILRELLDRRPAEDGLCRTVEAAWTWLSSPQRSRSTPSSALG
jgi:hypothetical protein